MQKAYGSSYLLPGGRRQRDLHCGRMCCWRHHVQEKKARSVPVSPRLGPDAEGTGADVSDRPALDTLSLALGGTPSLGARMAVAEAFMRAAAQPTSEPVCKSIAEPNLVLYLQHCGLKGRSHTPEFVCLVVVTVHEKMLHLLLLLPCLLQLLPSNKLTLGFGISGEGGCKW